MAVANNMKVVPVIKGDKRESMNTAPVRESEKMQNTNYCMVCAYNPCDSTIQHTYDHTCIFQKMPTPEEVAETERLKAMYDDNSHDAK